MTTERCESLHEYVDGELADDDRLAFEAHLAACDVCANELPRVLAMISALDDAAAPLRVKSSGPHLAVLGGTPAAARVRSASGPRRARWITAGMLGAVAAAAIALVILRPRPAAPTSVSLTDQLAPTRSIEARLSYPGTEHHRPLDVARGARSSEAISLDRMSQLERVKDWHGVAVAALLAGERERAARFFAQAPSTPEVDIDRAALELLDGSPAALERALDDVDRALVTLPSSPSALWNRALVLAGLDLPLAAAKDLDRVVAAGEPGWADEAKTRAASLRAGVQQRRTRWKQANDAGQKLIEDGTPVPAELLSVTGYMTIMLYDAVRAAPSRPRVEALLPMAQSLDAAYRSDRLATYVRRIAASDFRIRKPLADTYRELILKGSLPDAAVDAFLKRLEQTGVTDIWMGAVVRTGRMAAHLDEYRRLATASGDPWFAVIAEHETAKGEIARGGTVAAERHLREALATARRERLVYRAILLEDQLAALLRRQRRLSEAATEAHAEYRDTVAGGDWLREINALSELAAINGERYANGLTRASLLELLERSDSGTTNGASLEDRQYDCLRRQYAYLSLASVSVALLDPNRSRTELTAIPKCDSGLTPPSEQVLERRVTLRTALVWAELYRLSQRDEDARSAKASLAALRVDPKASPGEQALTMFVEANLLIETDRAEGQRLLRAAITAAGDLTDEFSHKTRGHGVALLALDAGRAGELSSVISLLADTLGVAKPDRCVVAVAALEGRSVVAFADARGEIGGHYVATGGREELDVSTLVPLTAVARLRACEHVTVLARAPVLGRGGLLPPDLAWSYAFKRSTPIVTAATVTHRLVIANPEPVPELNLPALGPYPDEPSTADAVVLRGRDATPTRVLQAMRDASVIEFHTHGFIANDVSEASYLVLSPELNREYAITAHDIEQISLKAAPLVILGACHAALSSRALEGGMGLAEALLRAGARAVIASPDPVQDLEAYTMFAAVRERVMQGGDPAAVVRDERVRRLATSHHKTWVSGVVVFE